MFSKREEKGQIGQFVNFSIYLFGSYSGKLNGENEDKERRHVREFAMNYCCRDDNKDADIIIRRAHLLHTCTVCLVL